MSKLDLFTLRRLRKFVEEHRDRTAQYPTLRDLDSAGFDKEVVESAVREGKLVSLYVTLTTGAVVKGFKVPN